MKEERKPQNAGKKSQTKFDRPRILEEVIEWVSQGNTLRDYCRQEGKPKYVTIYSWLRDDPEHNALFEKARETGHDVIADECMQIADEMPPSDANGKMDSGYVAWQKNRIFTRTQLLAKWNPRKYGDKQTLNHEGGVTLNVVTGIPSDDH